MLSEAQRQDRIKYLGGSDAGTVMGINKYKSVVDLYLEKTGHKPVEDLSNNIFVKAGNMLEPAIRNWFEAETEMQVDIEPETLYSTEYPWMCANIDGRIHGKNEILEIKTASRRDGWGEHDDNQTIPESYLAQVAHYCIVTGADRCHIAVLFGGVDFACYLYERNPRLEAVLIREEQKFWEEHVLKGIAPAPKSTKDVISLLGEISSTEMSITVANDEVLSAIDDYSEWNENAKICEKNRQEAKDKICAFMREHSILLDPFGNRLATWKYSKGRRSFDKSRLQAEMPEIYMQYEYEAESDRRFLLNKGKE